MIALGRPLLADAEIPNKIFEDKYDKVRPCLSCQEGCMGRLQNFATVSCAVNPACGREKEYGLKKQNRLKSSCCRWWCCRNGSRKSCSCSWTQSNID